MRSAMQQQDSSEIPEKRTRMCTSDDTDSKTDRSSSSKKDKSSQNVIGKVGSFFKKMTKRMKSTFSSRKRKCLLKTQTTSAGIFTITNIRKKMVVQHINGFEVVPADQDFKDEPM